MTHGKLFLAMYGVVCSYFSSAMVRLQLVLAPVVCIMSAIAVAQIIRKAGKSIRLYLIGHQIVENSKVD
jgi:dolichyl-diphosphooligosaccharide--protein glycosyltransferase